MIVSAAKASEAADVLGVELTGLTPDALGKAYKLKAKECHPDHHGSDKLQQWARVSWANDCLKFWIKKHPPVVSEEQEIVLTGDCRACKGTGRVEIKRTVGFNKPMTMACIICRGSGSVEPEEHDHD